MDCRALALAVLLFGSACGGPGRPLRAGDPMPAEWLPQPPPVATAFAAAAPADSAVVLLWAFRTNDTFSCQSFDYVIRRLQGTHAAALPFAAVHVGRPSREQIVEQFFRSRRIQVAHRVTVAPGRFRREFADPGLPSLMIVRGRRIVWSSALPQGVSTPAQMDSVVMRALRTIPTPNGSFEQQDKPGRARGTIRGHKRGAEE